MTVGDTGRGAIAGARWLLGSPLLSWWPSTIIVPIGAMIDAEVEHGSRRHDRTPPSTDGCARARMAAELGAVRARVEQNPSSRVMTERRHLDPCTRAGSTSPKRLGAAPWRRVRMVARVTKSPI